MDLAEDDDHAMHVELHGVLLNFVATLDTDVLEQEDDAIEFE